MTGPIQSLGTEWGRALRADFWLRAAELALGLPDAPIHDRIVITDVRFANEAAWIGAHGGLVVRVQRDSGPVAAHVSEQEVDTIVPWALLHNDGSLQSLHHQVDVLVGKLEATA